VLVVLVHEEGCSWCITTIYSTESYILWETGRTLSLSPPYSGGHTLKSRAWNQQPSMRVSAVFFSGSPPCWDYDKVLIHGVEFWSILWIGTAVSSEIPMNIYQNARRPIRGLINTDKTGE